MRHDGRKTQEFRKLEFQTNIFKYPGGPVVIHFGDTTVIYSATIENSVPPFLRETGTGRVTAECNMLPRTTGTRDRRESSEGKLSGKTMEIQCLIDHSLRAIVDLGKSGERNIIVSYNVIQAGGGTKTASIIGASVALKLAAEKLLREKELSGDSIREHPAAVSIGILPSGTCAADLDYREDSAALVDMNLVTTESGEFAEIQGTGKEVTFDGEQLNETLFFGKNAIKGLIKE